MQIRAANNTDDKNDKPISRGERIFDLLAYGGLGGVVNFFLTLGTTYWAKYGHGGKYFKGSTDWLQKRGWSETGAEKFMMTNATMQGGNIMALAVKKAEDNKIPIIKKIDSMLGDKTDVAALEAEDKQSWSSIIKARVVAWLTVFTSIHAVAHLIGDKKFGEFEESFAKNVVCKPLGKPTHVDGKPTKAFHYGKIAAIDLFATISATILLYVGSRVFAHWEREKQDKQHPEPAFDIPTQEHGVEITPASKAVAKILDEKAEEKNFAASVVASRHGGELALAN